MTDEDNHGADEQLDALERDLAVLLAAPELWAQPSDELEDRVVAAIAAERESAPDVGGIASESNVVSIDSGRRRRWLVPAAAALVGAAAAALVAVVIVHDDEAAT